MPMLSDDEILDALKAAGIPRDRPWARDVGPYEVTEPTYDTKKLVAEIERRCATDPLALFHKAWGYAKEHSSEIEGGYDKAAFGHVQFWLSKVQP